MKTQLQLVLAVALAALVTPLPAQAPPDPGFEAAAFLAGHCWKGTMPDGKSTDEHCFSWVYEGRFMRDRHVVRAGDKAVYEGESTYYMNPVTRQLEYIYLTARGGYSVGKVEPRGDVLNFPAAVMHADGKQFAYRGTWKRLGPDAYEVLREYETDKGWVPVRMEMKRVK